MMADTTQVISRSANRFLSGTMLSRITGLLRDMAMAFAFGTSGAVASFLMALRFAHLLRRIFGEGALQSAFVPMFEELRHKDSAAACFFFRDLVLTLGAILLGITALGMMVLEGFVVYGHLSDGNSQVLHLTYIMLPSLIFICLFGVNAVLLQCEKSFFTPSVAPVAFNGIWIFAAIALRHYPVDTAMKYLSLAIILACFGQWAWTLPKTLRAWYGHTGATLWRHTRLFGKDIRAMAKPLALGVIGITAGQINAAIDAIFARIADEQGPALLWYAIRIQQLPVGLFGVALSGALLPPLTRAIKQGRFDEFGKFFSYAIQRNLALMLPITAALILLAAPSINLVFGRGLFGDASTQGTTWCLWGYAVGLVPMTLVLIMAPAFYAQNDYRTPAMASVISVFVNVALDAFLILVVHLGAMSVAVATSVAAFVNMGILQHGLKKHVPVGLYRDVLQNCKLVGFATCVATLTTLAVLVVFFRESTLPLLAAGYGHPTFPRDFATQILYFAVPTTTFVVSALAILGKKNAMALVR